MASVCRIWVIPLINLYTEAIVTCVRRYSDPRQPVTDARNA